MTITSTDDDPWAAYHAAIDRLQADVDAVAVYVQFKRPGKPIKLAAQAIGRDPLRVYLLVDPEDLWPVATNAFEALGYGVAEGWHVDAYGTCEAGQMNSSHQAMEAYEKIKRALVAAGQEPA